MRERAPKGGTVGKNGEQYSGGCFLPTTNLTKMATPVRTVAPNYRENILTPVRAFCTLNFDRTVAVLYASDYSLAYYGKTRADVQSIVDRYNAGER